MKCKMAADQVLKRFSRQIRKEDAFKNGRAMMVRVQAINGTLPDPGGWSHFRQTIETTAARPPFIPILTQNQSIAGTTSPCGLASGSGWPTRGNPSIAPRILFSSSRSDRRAAKGPAKARALSTEGTGNRPRFAEFVYLCLKRPIGFIE